MEPGIHCSCQREQCIQHSDSSRPFQSQESQIFRSFYRHPRTIPSFLCNYLSLSFPHLLGRINQSNQAFQYFEGQCNHSAREMARIAVLFFTTLQAWLGQPSTPATAAGILCPDWKKVKRKNIPMQPDQKPIYPSDSNQKWCWQKGQNKWHFLQLPALQSYSTRGCKGRRTSLPAPFPGFRVV